MFVSLVSSVFSPDSMILCFAVAKAPSGSLISLKQTLNYDLTNLLSVLL